MWMRMARFATQLDADGNHRQADEMDKRLIRAQSKFRPIDELPHLPVAPYDTSLRSLLEGKRWKITPYEMESKTDVARPYRVGIDPHPVPGVVEVAKENDTHPTQSIWYRPDLAEHEVLPAERTYRYHHKFHPNPELKESLADLGEQEAGGGGFLYRGIHADELANILSNWEINSDGSFNLSGQEGVTCFTTDPRIAEIYANGFAPYHAKPNFTHPGYVIKIRFSLPEDAHLVKNITSRGEIELKGPIEADRIVDIFRAQPYAVTSGFANLKQQWPDPEYAASDADFPSAHVGWERAEDQMEKLR